MSKEKRGKRWIAKKGVKAFALEEREKGKNKNSWCRNRKTREKAGFLLREKRPLLPCS